MVCLFLMGQGTDQGCHPNRSVLSSQGGQFNLSFFFARRRSQCEEEQANIRTGPLTRVLISPRGPFLQSSSNIGLFRLDRATFQVVYSSLVF